MAITQGINNLGNGNGFIYMTDKDNTFCFAQKNTVDGARKMRQLASVAAPIAANRSAQAIIEVTGANSSGNLTVLSVNGVNQIGASVPCLSAVLATVAASWAAAINSWTPGSGYDFTAYSIGAFVYLNGPVIAGSAANLLPIVITTDDVTLTATENQQLINGSSSTGVTDENLGLLFFLNSASNAPATPASFPLGVTDEVEITKYIVERGMQVGMPTIAETISGDGINTDRYSTLTTYVVDTQAAAATDYLVQINPEGFVESDIIIIKGANAARVTTVVSQPNASGVSSNPSPNIYLNGNENYSTSSGMLLLQYHYDSTLGGIFQEIFRSTAVVDLSIIEVTYAEGATLVGTSGLLPGRRYKVTDRGPAGVFLDADTINRFKQPGAVVASYSGVLNDESCIYNFPTNEFFMRHDIRSNVIEQRTGIYDSIAVFPFGVNTITGNKLIDCVPSISSIVTQCRYNYFNNVNIFIGNAATVLFSYINGCQTNVTANATFNFCHIQGANSIVVNGSMTYTTVNGTGTTITVAVGGTIINALIYGICIFTVPSGYVMIGEFYYLNDTDLTKYTVASCNGFYKRGSGSTLEHLAPLAGLATYTSATVESAGIITFSGYVLPVNTVTLGTAISTPVIFRPASGVTMVLNDSTVAGGNIYLPLGVNTLTLNGTKGEYAVFNYQVSGAQWKYDRSVVYH